MRHLLPRGQLVRALYRLGRQDASGLLTLTPTIGLRRGELFVIRRGHAMTSSLGDAGPRGAIATRLARLASQDLELVFEGGVAGMLPPRAVAGLALAGWARDHLEAQLDSALADRLIRELAGVRIAIRAELAPAPVDDADRRMLAAMAQPRRLDQIWPLARTAKFRLLAFVHFLRAVDALATEGVGATRARPPSAPRIAPGVEPGRRAALRVLGVDDGADPEQVKRAYRRLARALHPDLQPSLDAERRRLLERRFAELTTAYEQLTR